MEVLNEAPAAGSFTPLAEHQSTTPASFTAGPPVLHYYSDRCKVIVLEDELQSAPALANLISKASDSRNGSEPNGTESTQKTVEDVDVWVTSDKLLLFSQPLNTGLSIPYPTISLHAIQSLPTPAETESRGLYMQLVPSLPSNNEEIPETVSITIIPTAAAAPATSDEIESEDQPQQTPVEAFFTALSDCSNLHPDPEEDEEEGSRLMQAGLALPGMSDGSLPPPMPGSGGWITAENMHEFVDEDGNFIEDEEELGPGAGTVRSAPDEEDEGDAKWQRMS